MMWRHLQASGALAWLFLGEAFGMGADHMPRNIQTTTNSTAPITGTTVSSIGPPSVTAGAPSVITLTGLTDGLADFFTSCEDGVPQTVIREGKGVFTIRELQNGVTSLKLCVKNAAGASVEQVGINLAVVSVTRADVIESVVPDTAERYVRTQLALLGATGGKAAFVLDNQTCTGVEATTQLDQDGHGNFQLDGQVGSYKVCYQAPGGTDVIEQARPRLRLTDDGSTKANQVTFISPTQVLVNVPTNIAVIGARAGDKAVFIPTNESCFNATPSTDLSTGSADFVFDKIGQRKLCLRSSSSIRAVHQQGRIITVVASSQQLITVQWTSKHGNLDCSKITQVPYCASQGIETCESSYAIMSGIGYKCMWKTDVWPPACTTDYKSTDQDSICKTDSCGGAPSQCW